LDKGSENRYDFLEIAAYSRLLATTRPYLLSHVYPHLINNHISYPPRTEHIWEWTRTTTVPKPTRRDKLEEDVAGLGFFSTPAGHNLFVAIAEWSLANGIKTLSLQCDPAFDPVVAAIGATPEILANPSTTTENQSVVPLLMHLKNQQQRKDDQFPGYQ